MYCLPWAHLISVNIDHHCYNCVCPCIGEETEPWRWPLIWLHVTYDVTGLMLLKKVSIFLCHPIMLEIGSAFSFWPHDRSCLPRWPDILSLIVFDWLLVSLCFPGCFGIPELKESSCLSLLSFWSYRCIPGCFSLLGNIFGLILGVDCLSQVV